MLYTKGVATYFESYVFRNTHRPCYVSKKATETTAFISL